MTSAEASRLFDERFPAKPRTTLLLFEIGGEAVFFGPDADIAHRRLGLQIDHSYGRLCAHAPESFLLANAHALLEQGCSVLRVAGPAVGA